MLSIIWNGYGWLLLFCAIGTLALVVPEEVFDSRHPHYLLIIGGIGLWRYGIGLTHYCRGLWFLKCIFPLHRKRAERVGRDHRSSRIYLLVTSFRIEAQTTAAVYQAALLEAMRCAHPVTLVVSIVELGDESLCRMVWQEMQPGEHIKLKIVRIPGTGKRDGLAQGFRAIARDLPGPDDLVAVIDGDTLLEPNVLQRCAPYFSLFPKIGGLTTNEVCDVRGSYWMRQWHRLRFAQRHINMCSMGLSRRVLTLTGRMSMFRASIVTSPAYINDIEQDELNHWRLGRFRFLTGDDKSSWYSLMRHGWDTYYVPDALITTVEHPPDRQFIRAASKLMIRWYGNSLRQNSRAVKLGVRRLGWLTYYILWDQRISMWTSLLGLTAALAAGALHSIVYPLIYLLWIALTRTTLTLLLAASGHPIGPAFPLLLYFNQIYGSLIKIYIFFRLDKQSWTRQKTALAREHTSFQHWFNRVSTATMTFTAVAVFGAVIVHLVR